MKKVKITNQEIADTLGISRISLWNKTSGKTKFTVNELFILIEQLGMLYDPGSKELYYKS